MAPDPRRTRSELLSPVNGDLLNTTAPVDENDNDDLDINSIAAPEGYTLFIGEHDNQFNEDTFNSALTDDDGNEDDDSGVTDEDNSDLQPNFICSTFAVNDQATACGDVNEENKEGCDGHLDPSINRRPDIAIDCDEIKAAMVGFMLPPSSIPPWASEISDSDINSHILKLLKDKNKKKL